MVGGISRNCHHYHEWIHKSELEVVISIKHDIKRIGNSPQDKVKCFLAFYAESLRECYKL